MRRLLIAIAVAFTLIVCIGSLPGQPVAQAPAADSASRLADAGGAFRDSRATLRDGRVLMTGGRRAGGMTARTLLAAADGTVSEATPMRVARSGHSSTVLADGRVLVAGGLTPEGLTTSAEIYDPARDRWTDAGSMNEPRVAHTATLLLDGRVLIAGGSSVEIFDPAQRRFSFFGVLSPSRSGHAAALLSDGRVLLVGGSGEGAALDFADLFDPASGRVTAANGLAAARTSPPHGCPRRGPVPPALALLAAGPPT